MLIFLFFVSVCFVVRCISLFVLYDQFLNQRRSTDQINDNWMNCNWSHNAIYRITFVDYHESHDMEYFLHGHNLRLCSAMCKRKSVNWSRSHNLNESRAWLFSRLYNLIESDVELWRNIVENFVWMQDSLLTKLTNVNINYRSRAL